MRLEDALKVSEVSQTLDHCIYKPCAQRSYSTDHISFDSSHNKTIISFGFDDFILVWSDTLKPISRNPQLQIYDFHKVIGRDDWEPL